MTLEEYLDIGVRLELGNHTFEADEIKRFAAKFDPQQFHLDEEVAARSVFGGLCASGWHTAAMWMKQNIAKPYEDNASQWSGPEPLPVLGPSPGFRDLKWLKPVYVGDTITYYRTGLSLRNHPRRPGWKLLTILAEGAGAGDDNVVEFTSSLLIDTGLQSAGQ